MFKLPPHRPRLDAALGASLAAGVFADTRLFVYSARAGPTTACRPRPVYVCGAVLSAASPLFADLLAGPDVHEVPPIAPFENADQDCDLEDEHVVTDDPAEWVSSNLPQDHAPHVVHTVVLRDIAFTTFCTLVWYLYTGKKRDLFLTSSTSGEGEIGRAHDQPRQCSAKSMYTLASKLGFENLRYMARVHLRSRLTPSYIVAELFSPFSARNPQILQDQIRFLRNHRMEPVIAARARLSIAGAAREHAAPALLALFDAWIADASEVRSLPSAFQNGMSSGWRPQLASTQSGDEDSVQRSRSIFGAMPMSSSTPSSAPSVAACGSIVSDADIAPALAAPNTLGTRYDLGLVTRSPSPEIRSPMPLLCAGVLAPAPGASNGTHFDLGLVTRSPSPALGHVDTTALVDAAEGRAVPLETPPPVGSGSPRAARLPPRSAGPQPSAPRGVTALRDSDTVPAHDAPRVLRGLLASILESRSAHSQRSTVVPAPAPANAPLASAPDDGMHVDHGLVTRSESPSPTLRHVSTTALADAGSIDTPSSVVPDSPRATAVSPESAEPPPRRASHDAPPVVRGRETAAVDTHEALQRFFTSLLESRPAHPLPLGAAPAPATAPPPALAPAPAPASESTPAQALASPAGVREPVTAAAAASLPGSPSGAPQSVYSTSSWSSSSSLSFEEVGRVSSRSSGSWEFEG